VIVQDQDCRCSVYPLPDVVGITCNPLDTRDAPGLIKVSWKADDSGIRFITEAEKNGRRVYAAPMIVGQISLSDDVNAPVEVFLQNPGDCPSLDDRKGECGAAIFRISHVFPQLWPHLPPGYARRPKRRRRHYADTPCRDRNTENKTRGRTVKERQK